MTDQDDSAQAEGEGTDGSDKPPHGVPMLAPSAAATHNNHHHHGLQSIPIPPPDSNAYEKQPGTTILELQKIQLAAAVAPVIAPHVKETSVTSSTGSTSTASSPTQSESGWDSAPSTRPPSRAPSMSAGTSGGKLASLTPKATKKSPVIPHPNDSTLRGKAPSVISHDGGGGHKFNLKDLLGSGPKVSRKSSQRSNASSRKSDAESDGGRPARSDAGGSTTSLSQKYGICQKLAIGKGATSVVRLAHKWDRSEEKLYAVKEFRKRRKNETEKEYVKKLTAEFCISSTLHHVNIVETVDLVQDEAQKWCEVMEFCPGGDLYAAIKKGGMSPSEVECCFKQILSGVAYLHSQGVAHRDLKPENLFFDTKGHLKIGDYGASTVYRLPWETTIHMSTGLCGSEPYIAPEQFLGKPYDARLVDIWACGIVYYCLHFQELPWRAAQLSDALYSAYATACSTHPLPATSSTTVSAPLGNLMMPATINNLSPRGCRTLIRQMLEPNPKKRLAIETIMKDKWVCGIEVCHEVDKPRHVHVHAQSLANAVVVDR